MIKGLDGLFLCDTNGGALPNEVSKIVSEVIKYIPRREFRNSRS